MNNIAPAVRILPMDSKEEPGFAGQSAAKVQQQYFLKALVRPGRPPGRYCFHKVGLRAEPGTVVLFQFDGKIIASGILVGVERFDAAEPGSRRGAYHFDASSIRVFDPVDAAAIREIWPNVKRLGQAKWSLDPACYPAFERRLTGVRAAEV